MPLVGYGVYKNDSRFYDNLLMPVVQLCPPEFSHRMAVLAFKYNLIPKQQTIDSERLVSMITFSKQKFAKIARVCENIVSVDEKSAFFVNSSGVAENQIPRFHVIESNWNCSRLRQGEDRKTAIFSISCYFH